MQTVCDAALLIPHSPTITFPPLNEVFKGSYVCVCAMHVLLHFPQLLSLLCDLEFSNLAVSLALTIHFLLMLHSVAFQATLPSHSPHETCTFSRHSNTSVCYQQRLFLEGYFKAGMGNYGIGPDPELSHPPLVVFCWVVWNNSTGGIKRQKGSFGRHHP